jgi:hypothetical protein
VATSINDQRNNRKILTDLPRRTHRSQGRPSLQLLFAATHTLQARFTYFLLLERGPSFDGCICKVRTNDDEYIYGRGGKVRLSRDSKGGKE